MKRNKRKQAINQLQSEADKKQEERSRKQEIIGEKPSTIKFHHILSISLILLISVAIYSNTLKNGFVYDDESTIVNNTLIKDFRNISKLFKKEYFTVSGEISYRPVVTLTYFFDYAFFGIKPWGYHLTNLLLHAANVILVYLFAYSLLGEFWIASLSALLFSLHPVQSEAVNAISYREDILIAFFLLPAFLIFLKISNSSINEIRWWTFYILSLLLYLLALFSKEMAVTFPLLLIGYHICFKNKEGWQKGNSFFYYLSGYAVVTLVYLFLYLAPFVNPDLTFGNHKPEGVSYPDTFIRLLALPKVLLKYLWLILFPWELKADYVVKISRSWTELFSIFLLLVIGAAVFHLSKRYRKELFGLLWLFISLLPVMNIVPINNVIAERYLYLPFVGISLLCSSSFVCLNRAKVKGVTIIIGLIILIYGGRTIFRNMDWRDDFTLWSKTVVASPESARANYNLGITYYNKGLIDRAIEQYQIALRLKPDYIEAHYNLGVAYGISGLIDKAIEQYQVALRLKPDYIMAQDNLRKIMKTEK